MSNGVHIEPALNEAVVWRHTGAIEEGGTVVFPVLSAKKVKVFNRFNLAFSVMFLPFLGWLELKRNDLSLGDPQAFSFLVKSFGVPILVLLSGFAVLGLIMAYLQKTGGHEKLLEKWFKREPNVHIPFWMSRNRLVFSGDIIAPTMEIRIKDIQSVTSDIVQGSPAMNIVTQTKSLTLISSEMRNVLRQLYTLRPDLKPTP